MSGRIGLSCFWLFFLHDILPEADLDCWQFFVSACKIFSSPVVSIEEIDEANSLTKRFFHFSRVTVWSQIIHICIYIYTNAIIKIMAHAMGFGCLALNAAMGY